MDGPETSLKLRDVCPPEYSPGGWCQTLTPDTMQKTFADDPPPQSLMWGLCQKQKKQNSKCTPDQRQSHSKNPTPVNDLTIYKKEHCYKAIFIQSTKSFLAFTI